MEKRKKENRFIDLAEYKNPLTPFQYFIGGRGIGKTYSAQKECLGLNTNYNCAGKFFWWRRTLAEWENFSASDPFKTINNDFNKNMGVQNISKILGGVYQREDVEGKQQCVGSPIGYTAPMLNVGKMRSLDFSDVTDIFYDEFIPEEHFKAVRGEANAFFNAYETVNRNREFFGKPPVNVVCMSNSENIYNPIFAELGIIDDVEKMIAAGKQHKYYTDRAFSIHLLKSPAKFMYLKSKTALYKMTLGTNYAEMALNNTFVANDFSFVKHRSVTGFVPWLAFGGIYLWSKKGTSELYATYTPARCKKYNPKIPADCIAFRKEARLYVEGRYINGLITFETFSIKTILLDVLKIGE